MCHWESDIWAKVLWKQAGEPRDVEGKKCQALKWKYALSNKELIWLELSEWRREGKQGRFPDWEGYATEKFVGQCKGLDLNELQSYFKDLNRTVI